MPKRDSTEFALFMRKKGKKMRAPGTVRASQ